MKQKAIDQALARLESVRDAISVFYSEGRSMREIRAAWWSFLLAANGVYSKLEQGAKGHGPSEAWFGRKKHERKKDDLLSYLHHARNSDEHSIEGSAAEHGIRLTPGNKWTKILPDGNVSVVSGKKLSARLHPPGIHLLPVFDTRFGDTFHPPQQHQGHPLPELTIKAVLVAAEAYLEKMIHEAQGLPAHV